MKALVTGAGARLGKAMALYLGQRGYDVAVHYASSADGAEETCAALRAMGRRAVPLQADLLDEDATQALVGRAADALGGPLTCLINNASIFEYDNIRTATQESWDRHLTSNLRAPFVLTQCFAAQAPAPLDDANGEPVAQALVGRAADALGGPLTCLINNASIFEYDNIRTATRDSWDRHLTSNLRAPFVLTQCFAAQAPAPIDDANGEPVAQALIVNMLDQRIHKLTPEFMTYTIAKMGLWAMTRTTAQALAPKVRVNGIGPGPTLKGHRQSQTHFDRQRQATILERGANPADITAALGYFLDAPAVTGQMLAVDGGQHLAWQTPDVLGVE